MSLLASLHKVSLQTSDPARVLDLVAIPNRSVGKRYASRPAVTQARLAWRSSRNDRVLTLLRRHVSNRMKGRG